MKFSFAILLFVNFCTLPAVSQTRADLIFEIKDLLKNNEAGSAEKIMESNYSKFKNDLEFIWLYAYTAHQNKNDNKSENLYTKAITMAPEDINLRTEFAKMLIESGDLSGAEKQINGLKEKNISNVNLLVLDATVQYWRGNYNTTAAILSEIDKLSPNSAFSADMKQKIKEIRAPFITINGNYLSDNQPLKATGEQLTIGQFRSRYFYPVLNFKNYNFSSSSNVLEASISNTFQSLKYGFSAKIDAGIYSNNKTEQSELIGEISISKRLFKNTYLKAGINQKPYLSTLESTSLNLIQKNAFVSLTTGKFNSSMLNISYNYQLFEDNNNIQTYSMWGLTKPLLDSPANIQLGYGINYSDSKFNTYTPLEISETGVTAYYSPYYTPDNQIIHSVILLLSYSASDKFNFSAKANYGFYAKNQSPYFIAYYDEDSSQYQTLLYSFSNKFTPYDLSLSMNYKINKNLSISAETTYFKTYFYNSSMSGISLNYKFF